MDTEDTRLISIRRRLARQREGILACHGTTSAATLATSAKPRSMPNQTAFSTDVRFFS